MTYTLPKVGYRQYFAVEYEAENGEQVTDRALFPSLGDARTFARNGQEEALYIFVAFFKESGIYQNGSYTEHELADDALYDARFIERVDPSGDKLAEVRKHAADALKSAGDEWSSDTCDFFAEVLREIKSNK